MSRGNRKIIVRGEPGLHDKIKRVALATGADKSTVVRTALGFMTEDQLATLIASGRLSQQSAVHRGQ